MSSTETPSASLQAMTDNLREQLDGHIQEKKSCLLLQLIQEILSASGSTTPAEEVLQALSEEIALKEELDYQKYFLNEIFFIREKISPEAFTKAASLIQKSIEGLESGADSESDSDSDSDSDDSDDGDSTTMSTSSSKRLSEKGSAPTHSMPFLSKTEIRRLLDADLGLNASANWILKKLEVKWRDQTYDYTALTQWLKDDRKESLLRKLMFLWIDKGEPYVHRFFLEIQKEPMTPFLQSIFTNILTYLETLKEKLPLSEMIIKTIDEYAEESGFMDKISEKRRIPSNPLSLEELFKTPSGPAPLIHLSPSTETDLLRLRIPKTTEAFGIFFALRHGAKTHYAEPFLDRIRPGSSKDFAPNPETLPPAERLQRLPSPSTVFASKHLALFQEEPHESTP